MKKLLIPLVLVIGLIASACNGHGSDVKDQFVDLDHSGYVQSGGYGYHNHEKVNSTTVKATFEYQAKAAGANSVLQAKLCVVPVVARDSDNEVYGTPYETCTSVFSLLNPGAYETTVTASRTVPAGYSIHAYESYVRVYNYDLASQSLTTILECQYHDPDDSNNPSFCVGRDANGNL